MATSEVEEVFDEVRLGVVHFHKKNFVQWDKSGLRLVTRHTDGALHAVGRENRRHS